MGHAMEKNARKSVLELPIERRASRRIRSGGYVRRRKSMRPDSNRQCRNTVTIEDRRPGPNSQACRVFGGRGGAVAIFPQGSIRSDQLSQLGPESAADAPEDDPANFSNEHQVAVTCLAILFIDQGVKPPIRRHKNPKLNVPVNPSGESRKVMRMW